MTKYKKLGGSKIYKEDISYLISEGKNQVLSNDVKRSILHTYNFNYVVDNVKFLSEPINIYADFFSHKGELTCTGEVLSVRVSKKWSDPKGFFH